MPMYDIEEFRDIVFDRLKEELKDYTSQEPLLIQRIRRGLETQDSKGNS